MSDLTSTNPNEPKISYTLNDLEVRSRHSLFHDANITIGNYIQFYTIMLHNISKIVYNYFYIIPLHQKIVVC
nr:MAG TPA: hypothetical protein [Caudoviricetes sp.]